MRNMQSNIAKDGDTLRVTHPVPWIVRVFGIPFLAIGCWFARVLIGSVGDALSSRGGVAEMLPGQLIAVTMMLAFLVPGIALSFGKRRLVIDLPNHVILNTVEFLGIGRTRRVSLNDFNRLRVSQRIKRNRQARDSITYDIELMKRSGESFLVGLATSARLALAMGEKVADYLHLGIEDHSKGDPEDDDAD